MIQVHCFTLEQVDALWRLLTHVPDHAFTPVDVYLDGTFRYRVIRHDGEQTTAPPEDPPACSSPAP